MKGGALWSLLLVLAACDGGTTSTARDLSRLGVSNGPYGQFIVDANGRSLYVFSADAARQSACLTHCAVAWAPAIVDRIPARVDPVVDRSKLSVLSRPDSTKQLTYADQPLYYSESDRQPGDRLGHYAMSFGGRFALISPAGTPLPAPR